MFWKWQRPPENMVGTRLQCPSGSPAHANITGIYLFLRARSNSILADLFNTFPKSHEI